MAHNLTEVDTHTANVSVPDPGDARTAASVETPLQALANRSLNAKNRIDAATTRQFGRYGITGTVAAAGDKFVLTAQDASGPTLATDEVTIAQDGLYVIHAAGTFNSYGAVAYVGIELFVGGVSRCKSAEADAAPGDVHGLSVSYVGPMLAGDKVKVVTTSNTTIEAGIGQSVLSIARVCV